MDQRRFLSFVVLSMMVFIGWYAFVVPALLPPQPVDQLANADPAKAGDAEPGGEKPADGEPANAKPAEVEPGDADPLANGDGPDVKAGPIDGADDDPADPEEPAVAAVEHPARTITLGSLDRDSGYFEQVVLTTRNAAVVSIALNDLRYRELTDDDAPLRIVGNAPSLGTLRGRLADAKVDGLKTLTRHHEAPESTEPERTVVVARPGGEVYVLGFDHDLGEAERERVTERVVEALERTPETFALKLLEIVNGKPVARPLESNNWAVIDPKSDWNDPRPLNPLPEDSTSVTFFNRSKDGRIGVRKRYWLEPLDPATVDLAEARGEDAAGYTLGFEVSLANLSKEPLAVAYELQGPVGVPLEDQDNARKFRDIKGAFYSEGSIDTATVAASKVVSKHDDHSLEKWTDPVKYLGVDVQYFVALVVPRGDPEGNPHLQHAEPELVERAAKTQFSDISVTMTSRTQDLAAGKSVSHEYGLFTGPKNRDVLASAEAADVVDFGWFPFGRSLTTLISNSLLSILILLHSIGLPYGLAIIGLTVIVRAAMFPISLKQNRNMQTMKELQPKIKELQTRYANDREKLGRAMMELYNEHGYNPLAGCLPMLLQLPIFIGLYQALGNAVELRRASFLWINNLAAPDALFELPFELPFLGSSFNLLPIVTIGLFIAQQKMFMPPPTDEQQVAQQKMMKYMMVFMGFMFYRVPAGLCIYFIASSLWGMGERQLLGGGKVVKPDPTGDGDAGGDSPPRKGRGDGDGGGRGSGDSGSNGDGKGSFFGRLLEKADAAANPNATGGGSGSTSPPKERKSRKDKGRRKSRK